MEDYKTVLKRASAEITVNRSRFIATVTPVSSEEEARAFIAEMEKEYWNARHNVYAYIIRQGDVRRYSDAGEPHSTAGLPALEVLASAGLFDVAVVITRYFGGILLGTGGLVRAYSGAVQAAVDAADLAAVRLCDEMSVICDYGNYEKLSALINKNNAFITATDFGEKVKLEFLSGRADTATLIGDIVNAFNGTVVCEKLGEKFAPFPIEK